MNTDLDIQFAYACTNHPSQKQLLRWASAALHKYPQQFSLCIRIVDEGESQSLNSEYRGKDKPTNVLSFCFEMPECVDLPVEILGDLVVCAPVVEKEAGEQNKALFDHWAHMIIHGTLHLLGFDHIKESEAVEMEQLERDILATLNIADPYQEQPSNIN